jgi:amidohydrolase
VSAAAAVKPKVVDAVDRLADDLERLSHQIHAHPELAFREEKAHEWLADFLAGHGAVVERGVGGLPTAFRATIPGAAAGPTVAIMAEYDALPGIGHACGHNVIATAGVGAGAALALALGTLPFAGRVQVIGTPAEEGGAGKVYMADEGAFDGVDVAMMVHPADADLLVMDAIACAVMEVEWFGEAAHAAAFPERGRNALDAAVLGYMNVAALRQHIASTDRIHGVFVKGGDRANIVPDHTVMEWMVRSARMASLEPLKERVIAAWEAGGSATGCRCEHRVLHRPYADMIDNPVVAGIYAGNAAELGRPVIDPRTVDGPRVVGSTDMGNVSYLVPSIHPMVAVAPRGVSIHSHEFTRYAGGPEGDAAVVFGAKVMAMTIADLWARPSLVRDAQAVHPRPPELS